MGSGMGSVRRNRRIGAWAALFALALQITLSFGHIHVEGIHSSTAAVDVSLAQATSRDGAPAPHRHHGANDICAICATIGLIASSVVPDPSPLLPPAAGEQSRLSASVSPRLSFDPSVLFQARAPPAVVI